MSSKHPLSMFIPPRVLHVSTPILPYAWPCRVGPFTYVYPHILILRPTSNLTESLSKGPFNESSILDFYSF